MPSSLSVDVESPAAMRSLAARVARSLSVSPGGTLLALSGPLGAGKTVFVRGLAEGLGIDPEAVRSPSFTLVNEYGPSPAGRRLIHLDLYRLDDSGEIEELGLGDYLSGDAVIAVEWGEKLPPRLLAGALRITIADSGDDRRQVTLPAGYFSPSQ